MTSSTEHHSTRGSAVPRLQARHVEQVVDQARQSRSASPPMSAHQLAALAVGDSEADPSAPTAVRIAVSGERRSCETARSSAVLSIVGAAQGARLDDLALQRVALDGGAEDRLERRHHALAQALDDVRRRVRRARSRVPTSQRQRDASLVAVDGPQLDRRRRQLERVGEALGDRRQGFVRLAPRSSSRAISAARSASWRRSWASRVRTRARSASVLAPARR